MTTVDPFRHDDAAYVMGALDDADRRAFEAHLETCAACRARVTEARSTFDLLALATVDDATDAPPMPDTLLPGLLRAAQRERGRRRWLTTSLGVVAAACVTALVLLLWPSGSSQPSRDFAQMTPTAPSPVSASAALVGRDWGTEVDLKCRYSDSVEHYVPYKLVVVDRLGHRYDLGNWTLSPGDETTFTSGTAVQREDIARVLITLQDNRPILALNL